MKPLLLILLLVTPSLAAWAYRTSVRTTQAPHALTCPPTAPTQPIPIEILEKGHSPKIIYFQATPQNSH